MDKYKVLLLDNKKEWHNEIVSFLENESTISDMFLTDNLNNAIDIIKRNNLDIVLMDINFNNNLFNGLNTLMELKRIDRVEVIILTDITDEKAITDSFLFGASDYVLKSDYKEILNKINQLYITNSPIKVLLHDYLRMKRELDLNVLSPSEKEIFTFVEKGYSRSQISEKLNKSESTVKNQTRSICKKLGVCRKKEAIKKIQWE